VDAAVAVHVDRLQRHLGAGDERFGEQPGRCRGEREDRALVVLVGVTVEHRGAALEGLLQLPEPRLVGPSDTFGTARSADMSARLACVAVAAEPITDETAGTIALGDLTVRRLGFGAMRITGAGIWGPPPDHEEALRVLRARSSSGST